MLLVADGSFKSGNWIASLGLPQGNVKTLDFVA